MCPAEDQLYYQARAADELALAQAALHPEAARAHAILADLYRERLAAPASGAPMRD